MKVGPDGQVDRLKACLVAKGYTQQYDSDYYDNFFFGSQDCLCSLASLYGYYVLMAYFFRWISRMFSFMVISLRRYIWSNRQVLLLRWSLVGMQATSFLIWSEPVSSSLV